MADKSKKIPKYKKIENYLLQNIKTGYYTQGQPIETEQELADKYGVSRVTVRQATNNLVARGLLSRSQGSGTYVSSQNVVGRATNVKSFTEEMEEMGKEVTSEILDFKITPSNNEISEKLKVDPESPIYFIKRLRMADGEPMMIESTHMNVKDFPDLTYESIQQSKYKYVEEKKKLVIDHSHHIVVPVMPTDEDVKYFDCDPGAPLLKILNTTYLSSGNILDFTELIINVEKYQYQSIRAK